MLLDTRELLLELAGPRDECLVVDPALLTPALAEIVAARLLEFPRAFVAFSSVTTAALESAVILAQRSSARFVFRGTPDERSALERALLLAPDSTLGLALLSMLKENMNRLPTGVRTRVESMFRNGDGPATPTALAAASALARRSLDRYFADAGFVSARRVVEAARVTAAYRAITTSRTPLNHVASMLGYNSQRTLDAQLQVLLDTTCGRLRAEPLAVPEAARRLAARLTERNAPHASRSRKANAQQPGSAGSSALVLLSGNSTIRLARKTATGER